MDKKYLYPAIILLAVVIDIISGRVLYNAYLNSGAISSQDGYASYTVTTMFLSFFLNSVFYVLVLWKFRENKLLSIYAALSIVVAFSFAGYVSLSNYFEFSTIIIRVYGGVSYFFGFINIVVAVSIILQEVHTKIVSISTLYFAITQFVFGTLVSDFIRGYLAGFFGPNQDDLVVVFAVYDIFLIILQVSVAVLQVYAIRSLIRVQEGFERVYRRM